MRAENSLPSKFEFYFPALDNSVLVENGPDGIIIRASRDNFTPRHKMFFIRELAAEGCIPDEYQWFSDAEDCGYFGVKWVIDRSWLVFDPKVAQDSFRTLRRMLVGAGLLWVVIMSCLFISGARRPSETQTVASSTPRLTQPATR